LKRVYNIFANLFKKYFMKFSQHQNLRLIPSVILRFAFIFILSSNFFSQEVYNVGGVANYNYVNGNSYDFITGNLKATTGKYLEIKLNAWNVNDRTHQSWGALTNLPKSYNSQFIFVPSYLYDRNGRPKPVGRNTPSWVSLYGSFTEHNPADWKKQSYNWPYGGGGPASKILFKGANYTTIALDLLEANWKYAKKSYSLLGSVENNLYQKTWSTHGDFFRERSNLGNGSIPGRNDPTPEFFIPDSFWNSHNYAHIQVVTTSLFEQNRYMNVNFKTAYNRLGLWHTYDTFLFPFLENGVKKTLVNNSPVVYYFGAQGGYNGSEATFLSFAQDKEGDQLIYRWVDGTNLLESDDYFTRNNLDFLYAYKNGYSADKPLKENTLPADNFYINPYSGTVNFTNSTDIGLRKSFVAIDQYKDGQLISTIINQVPFFSQSQSSSNTAPQIIVNSTTNTIAQKTSFDFDTDIPLSPFSITPPTSIKPYIASNKTRLRVPYKEVNNNGEVLLEGLDSGEGETVSFNIEVSDNQGDDIDFEVLPVDSDLMETYPWTLTSSETNTYNFEWNAPTDLDTETTLGSKSYLFMLYAKDNNEVLEGLPGRALKPISITVHKRPSVVITSTGINSGDTTNDSEININISLTDIDVTKLSDSAFTLTTDAFDLTNATLTNLTKTNNYSYTAVLNIADNLDATTAPVSTSVAIAEDKFLISKTGGHGINQVSLSNKSSNVFEWTSDQVRPTVTFEFFDTNGASLTTNSRTNDAYIVGKITISKTTSNFVDADLIFNNTNSSSSSLQKIEDVTGTYYTVKINASENTIGQSKITIPENVLSDIYGNQNLIGKLSSDNSVTEFIWNFDLLKPTVTITNPFAIATIATSDLSSQITFAFSETVTFNNKNFSDFTDDDEAALISVLNANTTNAFFTDFVFNTNNPNQFKATINNAGGNKTVVINAIEDFVRDLYGNSSSESSSSHSYNLDFPRLTNIYQVNSTRINRNGPLTYSQGNELSFLTSTASVDVLLSFSGQSENQSENTNNIGYESQETGLSFDISNNDINVSSGTLSNFQYFGLGSEVDESGNVEQLFKATYTPNLDYNGYVTFTIDADKFSNVSGVNNITSSKQILLDTNPPTVTFNVFTQYGTPFNKEEITNENYVLVEAKFSEPVDGFTVADLINGNSYQHKFPVISDFTKINDVLYTFKVTHTNGDGEYSFVNENKSFKDKQGIENTDMDLFNWYFDITSPTAEIEIYNGESSIQNQEFTANSNTTIKYVFSEPGISTIELGAELHEVLNLYTENIAITNASFDNTMQTITAVGQINTVGEVKINLPNNLFKDRGGNFNTQANERIYFYDNSVPEPSISISSSNTAIDNNTTFNAESVTVTYDFSVPLPANNYSDYSLTDLEEILSTQISNGTLSNFQKVDENTFSGTISDFDDGAIIVGYPKDLVFTDAGVKNTKANNVTIFRDSEGPEATVLLKLATGEILENDTKTNQSLVYATVTTSEISTNLSLEDFNFTGNVNASEFLQIDDLTYSFQLENTASSNVSISLDSNKFTDNVGNANNEALQISYNFDNVRPVPTITSSLINNDDTTNATTVPIEITFSEESLFMQDASRIESFISTIITNGNVADYSKNGNTIRFNINRVANGLVSIQLPENVFYDLHANGNTANSFQFRFEGSINLSQVELSSDNSLEDDYTLSYTWSNTPQTRTVPGTRTLITQNEIDYLYVNNSHTVTLNITAEADIIVTAILIDGQTLTANQVNGNAKEWQVDFPLTSATTEGKIEFEIRFTDSSGISQTPVKETTDGIYYKKDFTAPTLSAKIIRQGNNPEEIAYANEPLLSAIHSFVLTANETLYEEKAFALVNNINPSKTNNIYRGDLARFAAKLQKTQGFWTNYHNQELLSTTPNTTMPLEDFHTYFNGNIPNNEDRIYTDDYLILYPKFGNGNYQLVVPENYFYDLAGNKTTGLTISNLKVFQEVNATYTSAEINKKSCEYVTKAAYNRIRSNSISYTYFDASISVEISDDESFASPETIGADRIREINTTEISTVADFNTGSDLKKEYELDLEETTWIRFKTIDKISKELSAGYTEYFDESQQDQWEELISYSVPVKITVAPNNISVTGTTGICGLNEQETFTINTTGGLWSVSDNSIATINENTGTLTTLKTGDTEVIYTTTEGCNYLKKVTVFDTTTVQIEANGQASFCEGSSVTITSSISKNITWYKDDVVQPQLTSNTVNLSNVSDSGTYHVSYLTPCGAIVSNKIKVKVNALPTASKINTNE
jgi:hypothetical protein